MTGTAEVIAALKAAGIRTVSAYPGGRYPALTGAAAAVSLEELDDAGGKVTVKITVYVPAAQGGGACEEAAMKVRSALEGLGGSCIIGPVSYQERMHLLCAPVRIAFLQAKRVDTPYTVMFGTVQLKNIYSFKAWRETENPAAAPLSKAVWHFRIEERIQADGAEQVNPTEPFLVTVTRKTGSETFTGCRMTAMSRENLPDGLHLIRTGTAETRNFISVL